MASHSDLRPGAAVKLNGEKLIILEVNQVQAGRGAAYYQTRLKNIKTGRVTENRFRSGENIDIITVSRRDYQYLYRESPNLVFMDVSTYDQIYVPENAIGDEIRFLKENEIVNLSFDGDEVLLVNMPQHVNLEVIDTEPGLRGDTATNVLKPAKLETGATIQVPLFVETGDIIRLDTREARYIERVTK